MREITKESEINMSQTESALLSFLESNGGGTTITGETVTPTLISSQYKCIGNTQDYMTVVCLVEVTDE